MTRTCRRVSRILSTTRLAATTLAVTLFALGDAAAQEIQFPDFTSPAGLTLNGSAAATGGVLRLVPDLSSQAGSAFWATQLSTQTNFETRFQFQISGIQPIELRSDGMAFVIQTDPRGDTALGIGGGALGYSTLAAAGPEITPSVVIEFDIYRNGWDIDDRHVGLMIDGDKAVHVNAVSTPDPIDNGAVKNVSIAYDGVAKQLSVSFSEGTNPLQLLFTETVDIQALLGDDAWFGFTASTGGGFASHDVLNWELATACSFLDVTGTGLPSTDMVFDLTGAPAMVPAFLLIAHDTGTLNVSFGPLGTLTLGVVPPWIPVPLGLTDVAGSASFTVSLPPWPLPPMTLYAQTATMEFQSPPPAFVFCTSNVVPLTVGGP